MSRRHRGYEVIESCDDLLQLLVRSCIKGFAACCRFQKWQIGNSAPLISRLKRNRRETKTRTKRPDRIATLDKHDGAASPEV
jgi:hypothetical protein